MEEIDDGQTQIGKYRGRLRKIVGQTIKRNLDVNGLPLNLWMTEHFGNCHHMIYVANPTLGGKDLVINCS